MRLEPTIIFCLVFEHGSGLGIVPGIVFYNKVTGWGRTGHRVAEKRVRVYGGLLDPVPRRIRDIMEVNRGSSRNWSNLGSTFIHTSQLDFSR